MKPDREGKNTMLRKILAIAAFALATISPSQLAAQQTDLAPLQVAVIDTGIARTEQHTRNGRPRAAARLM